MTRSTRSVSTTGRRPARALVPVLAPALAGLLLLVLPAAPATAQELAVRFDPEATDVTFDVDATGHDVHGSFAFREGEIRFDPRTGAASGDLVVDATLGESGNGSRDKTMHKKVLESARFPLFVFHADEVVGELAPEGESTLELRGRLEIHGAEHPVSIPATVVRTGERFRSSAQFAVPYEDWGMHYPGFLFLRVAPEVQVTVAAEGRLEPADEMASATGGAHGGGR